jgi:hypothetical protein
MEKELRVQRYVMRRKCKSIYESFTGLRLNYTINTFKDRAIMRGLGIALSKLRRWVEVQTSERIKAIGDERSIKSFKRKLLMRKLKVFFSEYRYKRDIMMQTTYIFRQFRLKKKLFNFIKAFSKESQSHDNQLVNRFRKTYLKYKFMNMLKRYFRVKRREDYIFRGVEYMYKSRVMRVKRTIFNDWVRYYICERYRKMKMLKRKIKIFLALKLITLNN